MSSVEGNTLPVGWEEKKLGEILEIDRGGSPRPIKDYLTEDENGLNWIKIGDATNSISDKYIYETKQKIKPEGLYKTRLVKEGDFILSNSMSFGKPYIMKTEGCIHDGWLSLKISDSSSLETDFLYYVLSSPIIYNKFSFLSSGTTVKNLNKAIVASVSIPLPPLEEQKRIVSKINALFAEIDKAISLTEESLKQAKNLLPSVLKEVFETMDGVEKFLPDLVKEGRYSIKRGPFGSSLKKQFFVPSGYKVYEQKHAIKNDFEIGEYFVNEEKYLVLKAFELKPRDIIISCSGTIGKIAVAPNNLIPGIINQALLKISLNEDEIEIPFFTYWFNNYVNNGNLSTKGAAIKNIVSVKELKTIPLKVPNLNKQKEICYELDKYLQLSNQTQSKLEEQLAYLKQLKSSILSKAFRGEL